MNRRMYRFEIKGKIGEPPPDGTGGSPRRATGARRFARESRRRCEASQQAGKGGSINRHRDKEK
jgi:hypothetical protein